MQNKLIYNENIGKEVPVYNKKYDTFDTQVANLLSKNATKESIDELIKQGLNPLNSNYFITNSCEKYNSFIDEDGNTQPSGIAKINTTTCLLHEVIEKNNEDALISCINFINENNSLLHIKSYSNYVYIEPDGGMPDYYIPQTQILIIEDLVNEFNKCKNGFIRSKIKFLIKNYYNKNKDIHDGQEYFPNNLKNKILNILNNETDYSVRF